MSANDRFHNKLHRRNHHSVSTPGYPDSATDPIASADNHFKGDFWTDNTIYSTTSGNILSGIGDIAVNNVTAYTSVSSLSGLFTRLAATSGNIVNLVADNANISVMYATSAFITTLSAANFPTDFASLTAVDLTVTNHAAIQSSTTITDVTYQLTILQHAAIPVATIGTANTTNLSAVSLSASSLSAEKEFITISTIGTANTTNLSALSLSAAALSSTNATVTNATIANATVISLSAISLSAATIKGEVANVDALSAISLSAINAKVTNATITTENVTSSIISGLTANAFIPKTIATNCPYTPVSAVVHFVAEVSRNADFSTLEYSLSSSLSSTNFFYFNGTSFQAYDPTGIPIGVYAGMPIICTIPGSSLVSLSATYYFRICPVIDSSFGDWEAGVIGINGTIIPNIRQPESYEQAGSLVLGNSVSAGSVTFPVEMVTTPIVFDRYQRPNSTSVIIGGEVDVGSESSTGFNFTLTSTTTAAGYILNWYARV